MQDLGPIDQEEGASSVSYLFVETLILRALLTAMDFTHHQWAAMESKSSN
jgi:hypothetical protein